MRIANGVLFAVFLVASSSAALSADDFATRKDTRLFSYSLAGKCRILLNSQTRAAFDDLYKGATQEERDRAEKLAAMAFSEAPGGPVNLCATWQESFYSFGWL